MKRLIFFANGTAFLWQDKYRRKLSKGIKGDRWGRKIQSCAAVSKDISSITNDGMSGSNDNFSASNDRISGSND